MTLRFDVGFDVEAFGSLKISNDGGDNAVITTGKWCHLDISSLFEAGVYDDIAGQFTARFLSEGIDGFVTYSTITNRYRIHSNGTALDIECGADEADAEHARAGQVLGFSTSPGVIAIGATATGDVAPFFMIDADMGGASDDSDEYEGGQSEDAESEDGTSYGTAPTTAPKYRDFTVPFEPRAACYKRDAVASAPWTWQHFYEHTRVVHPFAVSDDYGDVTVCKHRAGSDRFKPRRVSRDWRELHDFVLKTRIIGRL